MKAFQLEPFLLTNKCFTVYVHYHNYLESQSFLREIISCIIEVNNWFVIECYCFLFENRPQRNARKVEDDFLNTFSICGPVSINLSIFQKLLYKN